MDRVDLERTLQHIEAETSAAQNEMLALQARLDALTKAREGLRALLDTSGYLLTDAPEPRTDEPDSSLRLDEQDASVDRQDLQPPDKPSGTAAARWVLQTDPTKFWTVRAVWEAEQEQRWQQTMDAVRIALMRLHERGMVERIEKPVMSYRWKPQASLSSGSGVHTTEGSK